MIPVDNGDDHGVQQEIAALAVGGAEIDLSVQIQAVAAHLDKSAVSRGAAGSQKRRARSYIGEAAVGSGSIHIREDVNVPTVALRALAGSRSDRSVGEDSDIGRMEHDIARVLPCLTVDRDFSRLDQSPGRIDQSYGAVCISNELVGSQGRTHSECLGQSVRHHSRCEENCTVSGRLTHCKTYEISAVEV